jgi:hypothetical protein
MSAVSNAAVTAVTRANTAQIQGQTFDLLVNAAMPSKRFLAKTDPCRDFVETVQKTADLFYRWRYGKFVQISTVSARCQLDTVYGRHKAAAEKLCGVGNHLIIRLGPLYSPDLDKGVLIDMLQGRKVYCAAESRYGFAPLEFVSAWIAGHLDRTGTVEVGARNAVELREVADRLGCKVEFEGAVDHQEIQDPEPDFPDAREVIRALDGVKRRLQLKVC